MPRNSKTRNNGPDDTVDAGTKRTARTRKRKSKTAGEADSCRSTSRKKSRNHQSGRAFALKISLSAVCAVVIALMTCFDLETASSNAMQPSIGRGDLVLSWAPLLVGADPDPGEIALVEADKSAASPNFLRVAAEGNSEVRFEADQIAINGVAPKRLELTNPAIVRPGGGPDIWRETLANGASYRIMLPEQPLAGPVSGRVQLAQDELFLIGDNRMASYDSRQTGPAPKQRVRGRALFIVRSDSDDGIFGHWIKVIR